VTPDRTAPLLRVRDLRVVSGGRHILQGVDLDVAPSGVTALLGRNGAGKTTTVRAVLGLVPRTGSVFLDGAETVRMAPGRADPGGVTGGEEGLSAPAGRLPSALVGIANTANLYWIALAYLVLTLLVVHWAVRSATGRVWEGIKENERRVEVLGLRPYGFKLVAFVLAGALAALGGIVYLLLTGGATPQTTTSDCTLSLLVMVVLGGSGSRWGPLIGGVLYTWADHRLGTLAGSGAVAGLPAVLRVPLSQPLFLLGAVFIAAVFLLPGGVVRLPQRIRERRARRATS
jgi:branched-chain amino acid transport system permease protein